MTALDAAEIRRPGAGAGGYGDGRAIRRLVLALSLSGLAEWGGASAILPLLPVYLRRHGSSVPLVGLTMGAFFLAAVAVQYPLGRLSDRIGRRTIQIAGLVTYAAATVLFFFFSAPLAALVFRALQGAGTGVVDVASAATIGEVVPRSAQGRAFGALYGMQTVGMAIGPLVGGLVGLGGMRWVFLAAAAPVLAAAAPIAAFVPGGRRTEAAPHQPRLPLWKNRSVLGVVVAFVAVGIITGMYEVCWSLLLVLRGATSWELGLSWTLFALPFAVVSLPAGWLVDRLDRRHLVVVALVGTGGFAAAYPFVHSVAWLIGLGGAEAVVTAAGWPAQSAQLAHSVPSGDIGRAQGAVATAQTAAIAVAATVSGALFGVAPGLPFLLSSAAVALGLGALAIIWRGVPGRGSAMTPLT
jgi:DHA1 family multidrug resistance protein-like MFS transporter